MADNITVKDGGGSNVVVASKDIGPGVQFPKHILYGADGNPLLPSAAALADGAANPTTGTVGADLAVWNGATWDRLKGDSTGAARVSLYGKQAAAGDTALVLDASGRPTVNVNGTVTVDSELPAAAALSDATANPSAPQVGAAQEVYNETTWERARSSVERVLLASAARTTTANVADQVSYNLKGLLLIVDVSAQSGGSVTPSLQVKDPISGNYATVWTAAAALVAVATRTYHFYPGASGGSFDEALPFGIPRTWRVVMTANNASSITYSVAGVLLP